jgi:tetratricopeptide (TPR) repeat protein
LDGQAPRGEFANLSDLERIDSSRLLESKGVRVGMNEEEMARPTKAERADAGKTSREFDVALSFAGEDRNYVDQVANLLRDSGVKVFYDSFEETNLWGKNLYDYLSDIYMNKASYTIMFISKHYADKLWTNHERQVVQARAFQERQEYMLPARFDETEIPGVLPTIGYISLAERTPKQFVEVILGKLISSGGTIPSKIGSDEERLKEMFEQFEEKVLQKIQESINIAEPLKKHPSPDVETRRLQELAMEATLAGKHEEANNHLDHALKRSTQLIKDNAYPYRLDTLRTLMLLAEDALAQTKNAALGAARIDELREKIKSIYDRIIREFGHDDSPDIQEQVASAFVNKGVTLDRQSKTEEALAVYEEIEYRFGQNTSPSVREQVAKAFFNKGVTLWQQGKMEEALTVYEKIEHRFGQDASPGVREQVASALFNKGVFLGQQGKTGKALAVYEEIDRRFSRDTSLGIRELVAMTLVNKVAKLFNSYNDAAGAFAVSNLVLERYGNSPEPRLQKVCSRALQNSVEPLLVLGKLRDAAQRIRQVQEQIVTADDGDSAIMAFLLWLAEPQTPEQTVREAICALPPNVQFGWRFGGLRPFILHLPAPRKARAQCFLAFFEQHHDAGKLDVCLGAME